MMQTHETVNTLPTPWYYSPVVANSFVVPQTVADEAPPGASSPYFYFHANDAVDDGSGNVLSLACRITGVSAAAALSTHRPTLNTSFVSGKSTVQNTAQTQYLSASIGGTWHNTSPTSFVARVHVTTNNFRMYLGVIDRTTATTNAQRFFFHDDEKQRYYRGAGTSITTTSATANLVYGTWQTFGWSFNGSSVTYYVDGVFDETDAASNTITNASNRIWLGNGLIAGAVNVGFTGHWGIIRVFNRSLSASEQADEHSLCAYEYS